MKVDYGAVALIPKGEFNATEQYAVNDLVSYNGSSFIVKAVPPIGTLPTNTAYFTTNASGTSPATSSTLGTVKPDNSTTVVDNNGVISVKSEVLDRVSSSEQALTVNLLNPTLASQTKYGITVTRNADNTYTFDGVFTSDNDTAFILQEISAIGFKDGTKYKLIGDPSEDPRIAVFIGSLNRRTSREGMIITPPFEGTKVYIKVFPGADFTEPVTIKPMITTNLSATYDDFVPFSGSSGKLDTDFKTLSEKIGNVGNTDLQSQLNAATQSIAQNAADVAQNTTDIAANAAGIGALNTGLTQKLEFVGNISNKYSNLSELYTAGQTNNLKMGVFQWNTALRPVDVNGIVFIGNWSVVAITGDFRRTFLLNSNSTWTEITKS